MTLTRGDLTQQMVTEYRQKGSDAAIALFDRFIREHKLSQFCIRQMILEFREQVNL